MIEAVSSQPKPMSVFICLFTYGGITDKTMQAINEELAVFEKVGRPRGITAVMFNVHGDALISRSRSKALSVFLESKHDVCFMVDHDLEWSPGTLMATAMKAQERQCIVAGLYACRGIGRGLSSRMVGAAAKFKVGEDMLLDAEYLASGFMAIPRIVVEETLKAGLAEAAIRNADARPNLFLHHCVYNDGTSFYDFFRPICVQRTVDVIRPADKPLAQYEYLSEDWAFCYRARKANENRPLYAWTIPWLVHHGDYGYTLLDAYTKAK